MNLRFLETFVWVARLNSFSLAAEKLHASPATVSARIAALEQELGVKLFQRGGRDTTLTPQGEKALIGADKVLRVAAEFQQQLGGGHGVRETIRIGVIDSIAFSLLPLAIDKLRLTYPNLNLELHADTSLNLSRQLNEGKLHLALLMGHVEGVDIVSRPLFSIPAVCVAGASFECSSELVEMTSLVDMPIIAFPKGSSPYEIMRGYFARDVFQNMRISTSNSVATIIRMVADGLGVAILPEALVAEDIKRKSLKTLTLAHPFPPFEFHIAYIDTPETVLPSLVADLIGESAIEYGKQRAPELRHPAGG